MRTDESPVAKKKAIEADLPSSGATSSNDYECVGFDNPSFSTVQSRQDGTTVAELEED